MSEEQLKAFWDDCKADSALKQKIQGITDPDAIVVIAKETGFSISTDDLKNDQAELSDEELGGVVGGEPWALPYW